MAKVKRNMIVSGVSGSLGEEYYARITRDGRTIISRKPNFGNRQFSEAQLKVQSRTRQAAAYAKVAAKKNPIYAQKARGTAMNAYNIAVRDWHRPPVIDSIDLDRDGKVRVDADDDVMVTRVTVAVLDEAGRCLEQGEAVPVMGIWWDYQTANPGQIRVEAWDLAGNVTQQDYCPPTSRLSGREKPVKG